MGSNGKRQVRLTISNWKIQNSKLSEHPAALKKFQILDFQIKDTQHALWQIFQNLKHFLFQAFQIEIIKRDK
jgi:hypothetical protein